MNKTVGIIAEYNPFHKGHEYHIRRSKEMTGAKYCIVVMSGDYVQRGQAALVNKYERTKWALDHGADLVLELPVPLCCASAEYFAKGGVRILNDTSCVDFLSFGSECGDIEALDKISSILENEDETFKAAMQDGLKNGLSFPVARATALECTLREKPLDSLDPEDAARILKDPNNVLALEYIRALSHFESVIRPVTVKRQGAAYNDDEPDIFYKNGRNENDTTGYDVSDKVEEFVSASAIRKALKDMGSAYIRDAVPQDVYETLTASPLLFDDDLSGLIHYRLLTSRNTRGDYTSFGDISIELSNRMENHLTDYTILSEFISLLKTRNYTHSRISRALLNILLDIYKYDLNGIKRRDYGTGYAILLGFKKDSGELLSAIKEKGTLKLITKQSDLREINDSEIRRFMEINLCSSAIYNCLIKGKYGSDPKALAYGDHAAFSPIVI